MTIVEWDSHVNQKVRRSGGSWAEGLSFIENTTRSGKTKRRLAHSGTRRKFGVNFMFTKTEYSYFTEWFNTTLRKGVYGFHFPAIDGTGVKTYRMTSGGIPKYNNPSGDMIACTMEWEEV